MEAFNPVEETKAFVEMVKLAKNNPDLKEISVFFPDAALIPEEEYKSKDFGEGLYLLMRTDPYRFSRILECHVRNYNYLGFTLVKENPSPLGKLVGMFILSVAFKNTGVSLFEKLPPPFFFERELKKIISLNNATLEEFEKKLKEIKIPEGIKSKFISLVSPEFYWNEYKKTLPKITKEAITLFLASLNSIYSSLLLLSVREYSILKARNRQNVTAFKQEKQTVNVS